MTAFAPNRRPLLRRLAAVWGTLAAAACASDEGPLALPPLPVLEAVSVNPGVANVLSATVTVVARDADSAVVRFGTAGHARDSMAPAITFRENTAEVPLLGLLSATPYTLQVTVYGNGGSASGEVLHFTTGTLPPNLPSYSGSGTAPAPGYVVFAAAGYGVAIDNTGRVVWYVPLPDVATLNFQPQPTNRYYTRATTPTTPLPWLEIDPLGNVTRELGCARGLIARFHDLIALADGSYWLMCDETRTMDLSAFGGRPDARVTGTVVQHVGPDRQLLFEWSPFDHFSIDDLDPAERAGPNVNWTHGNAIDRDLAGNLLVSFRSLSEITSIDVRTGAVRWRMGGRANQFTFAEPMPPFRHQHGLRVAPGGALVLLDNLGESAGSRAERYYLDQGSVPQVQLLTSLEATPATVAQLGGTIQILPDDRLLVAFGNGNRVQEFDATGAVVWEIQGNSGYVFRATRTQSLYEPGAGLQR